MTPPRPAIAGGIVLIVFGALILVGTATRRWFTIEKPGYDIGVGLVGRLSCSAVGDGKWTCEDRVFDPAPRGSGVLLPAGLCLVFAGGLTSASLATIAGIRLVRGRARSVRVGTSVAVFTSTLAGMVIVVLLNALQRFIDSSTGTSAGVAILGVAGALIGMGALVRPAARREAGSL